MEDNQLVTALVTAFAGLIGAVAAWIHSRAKSAEKPPALKSEQEPESKKEPEKSGQSIHIGGSVGGNVIGGNKTVQK